MWEMSLNDGVSLFVSFVRFVVKDKCIMNNYPL